MHRTRQFSIAIAWIAAAALFIGACQTPPPPEPEPEPAPQPEFRETPKPQIEKRVEEVVPELRTIYFDFDRSDIRADARAVLRANAEIIRDNPRLGTITLQGNCDERGSEEYNLGLGERRAMAVKRYLADLGVPTSRIDTVSFGEMKPAVMGHDESAWRWNRRVDFASAR